MSVPTILLVDDDEVLRQVLRRVLTRDGYTVTEAGSVAQALERAREQPPALALLDLQLPDGDGVELARKLEEQIGRFPLILLTAYPLRLRDEPELTRGFVHVLTKPLNLDDLRRAIGASLGAATGPRESFRRDPQRKAEEPAPVPVAATPLPPTVENAAPTKRRTLHWWAMLIGILVVIGGLIAVLPVLGMPGLDRLLKPLDVRLTVPNRGSRAHLVPGRLDEIELPREVVERLGVVSDPVQTVAAPRPLALSGSLSFDPNKLYRVQSRFAGEVVSIGTTFEQDAEGQSLERELRYGDSVAKGQVIAVVLSKDLGEKKSELIDALVRLTYEEAQLEAAEDLIQGGHTPAVAVRAQRTAVVADRIKVEQAELTLRTWRVSKKEIDAVKEEAKRVFERKGRRDLDKETEWAKVEVRAPFDGTIVEKNLAVGNIVSTDFDLFKIADLRKLGVVVHAYEEDLTALRKLPRSFPWKIRGGADLNHRLLQSDGIRQLGLVVDPTQHTAPVMGLVDNSSGELRVGQFVTATVELPAPPNVVALPSSAVNENGADSVIFVQPDPAQPRYVLRRVSVAMRLRDVIYVRSELSEEDRKKGLREVRPGEHVVSEGVLELQSALEDLQAKAKAKQ